MLPFLKREDDRWLREFSLRSTMQTLTFEPSTKMTTTTSEGQNHQVSFCCSRCFAARTKRTLFVPHSLSLDWNLQPKSLFPEATYCCRWHRKTARFRRIAIITVIICQSKTPALFLDVHGRRRRRQIGTKKLVERMRYNNNNKHHKVDGSDSQQSLAGWRKDFSRV